MVSASAKVPGEDHVSTSMSREKTPKRILDDIVGQRRGKDRAIVVVLGAQDRDELMQNWKGSKLESERDKSPVFIIRRKHLQNVISEVTTNDQIRSLTIMGGEMDSQLSFQVPSSSIRTLKIRSCGHSHGDRAEVFVDGSSEFHGRRLDEWKAVPHAGLKIHIGRGVQVYHDDKPPSKTSRAPGDDPEDPSSPGSSNQADQSNNDDETWDYIKTMISVVIGTCACFIAASAKVAGQATGGSFSVDLKNRIFTGSFMTGKAAATLSLPWCVFTGVAVGVAVYYVLSTNSFPSLKSTLMSWTSSLRKWWNNTAENGTSRGSNLPFLFN
ncbi:hypothetical protein FMUND_2244 [Fusarium mundagurra]|uniref:Uncharacterized protein n=1 Tax=Fusarium mundagurra TaxID=1567541 RepID=A0A8H5Z1H8_9HYPO|nr:hypothetical protein FMUND_2244 [Fusarium mundagurra]